MARARYYAENFFFSMFNLACIVATCRGIIWALKLWAGTLWDVYNTGEDFALHLRAFALCSVFGVVMLHWFPVFRK